MYRTKWPEILDSREIDDDMLSIESQIVADLSHQIYGDRYCQHCDKVQPVRVYELVGSREETFENMTFNVKFLGSRVCAICFKEVS